MKRLVLSLFPGIGLLDRAFEEEGFCVVRGPDVLWGGDVRKFHPPPDVFDGVIGGPPCQSHSRMGTGQEHQFGDMTGEYERCVVEARPKWFLMENVREAPSPSVPNYETWSIVLEDHQHPGGRQSRVRRFSFGQLGVWRPLILEYKESNGPKDATVLAGHDDSASFRRKYGRSRTIQELCEAQGLPLDFTDHMPFTVWGKRSAIGNGVPMAMGRAIAQAVKRAIE